MGKLIIEDVEKLIAIKRKKKFYKKLFLLLLLLTSVMITLALKLPYFNIKSIDVIDNKNIPSNKIIEMSGVYSGNNIFYVSIKDIKENIKKDPYILDATVKRKLPNKIIITVSERKAVFYGKLGNKYLIVDSNGILLEKRSSIFKMNLVKLEGVQLEECEVGKEISFNDNRKTKIIKDISNLLGKRKDNFGINVVNVNNPLNILMYKKDMCIKLGTEEDLKKKMTKAFNILERDDFKKAKGYIDLSYKGNPVVFVEK